MRADRIQNFHVENPGRRHLLHFLILSAYIERDDAADSQDNHRCDHAFQRRYDANELVPNLEEKSQPLRQIALILLIHL